MGWPGTVARVVSTSLVTLAVVVAAIGFALALAVGEPDQPATLRRSRDRKPARLPARLPAPRTRRSPVARLRSGLALTGLMVVLGAVLAALVAGLAVALVLGLRRLVA